MKNETETKSQAAALTQAIEDLAKANAEIDELKAAQDFEARATEALLADRDAIDANLAATKAMLKNDLSLTNKLAENAAELARVQAVLNRTYAERDNARDAVARLEEEAEDPREKLVDAAGDALELIEDTLSMKAALAAKDTIIAEQQATIDRLAVENDRNRAGMNDAGAKLNICRQALQAAERDAEKFLRQRNDTRAALAEQRRQGKDEAARTAAAVEFLTTALRVSKADLEAVRQERAAYKADYNRQGEALLGSVRAVAQEVVKAQKERDRLKAENGELANDLAKTVNYLVDAHHKAALERTRAQADRDNYLAQIDYYTAGDSILK